MDLQQSIQHAVECLAQGQVVAYPTEAVFGLGCDPCCEQAVKKVCAIKQRPLHKGLILVACDWSQVECFIQPVNDETLQRLSTPTDRATTWLLPANSQAPTWITGGQPDIAIRISEHPVVKQLCQQLGKPIVSTSANLHGEPPCRDYASTCAQLTGLVDWIIDSSVGDQQQPSRIIHAISNQLIRP